MPKEGIIVTIKVNTYRTVCTGQEYKSHTDGRVLIGRMPTNEELAELPEIQPHIKRMDEECKTCTRCKKYTEHNSFYIEGQKINGSHLIPCVNTFCQSELVSTGYPKVCPITGDPFHKIVMDQEGDYVPLYKGKELHTLPTPNLDFSEFNMQYCIYNEEAEEQEDWDETWQHGSMFVKGAGEKLSKKLDDFVKELKLNHPDVDISLLDYISEVFAIMNNEEEFEDDN